MKRIAGVVPFTTIDFPGCLAAVVFFQGCPLRCPFCHNPNLQSADVEADLSWQETLSFLKERQKRLDGVVLSGGEPLMQVTLPDMLQDIRDLGFQTALHTSGIYPERLKSVLSLLDWVGLDIKAPADKYDLLTGRSGLFKQVSESLHLLLNNNIVFEARTTADPRFLTPEDIRRLAVMLKEVGVQTYALQKYRTFDGDKNPPSQNEIDRFFEDEDLLLFLKENFVKFVQR